MSQEIVDSLPPSVRHVYSAIFHGYMRNNAWYAVPNQALGEYFVKRAWKIDAIKDENKRKRELEWTYTEGFKTVPGFEAPVKNLKKHPQSGPLQPGDNISGVGSLASQRRSSNLPGPRHGSTPRPPEAGRTSHQTHTPAISGSHRGGSHADSRHSEHTLVGSLATKQSKGGSRAPKDQDPSRVGGPVGSTHLHTSSHRDGGTVVTANDAKSRYSSSSSDPRGSGKRRGDTVVSRREETTTTRRILGMRVKETKSKSYEYEKRKSGT